MAEQACELRSCLLVIYSASALLREVHTGSVAGRGETWEYHRRRVLSASAAMTMGHIAQSS
eukprot:6398755-Amphidinium_carterae.1